MQRQIFDADGSSGGSSGRAPAARELASGRRADAATAAVPTRAPPTASVKRARRRAALVVAALVIFTLALRLAGIGFMLPHLPHVDERVYLTQVEMLRGERVSDFEWRNFRYYPHLVAHLCALVYPAVETAPSRSLAESLTRAAAPLVRIRTVLALLSVALVPATYLLARRFLARAPALFAAGLAAASVLGLWYAQQARPHVIAAVAGLVAVLAALEVRRRGDLRSYLLAGTATGIALATLQSLVFVLPAIGVAHLVRARTATRWPRAALAVAYGLAAAIALLFYPFALERRGVEPSPPSGREIDLYGHGILLDDFNGRGFASLLAPWRDYDPLLFALVLLGLAVALACAIRAGARAVRTRTSVRAGARRERVRERLREHGDLLVVASAALTYLLVLGVYQRTFQRFALPLLPYVACFAAWGLSTLVQLVLPGAPGAPDASAARARERVVAAAALGLFALQASLAAKVTALRCSPDTATRAARWIEGHLEPGADRIAVLPPLDLPLYRSAAVRDRHYRRNGGRIDLWPRWQNATPPDESAAYHLVTMPMHAQSDVALLQSDPEAYLAGLAADYAVFEVNEPGRRPLLGRLREAARANATLIARFSPWADPARQGIPILYYWDSESSPERWLAWRMLSMQSLGPTVEIYRLGSPGR